MELRIPATDGKTLAEIYRGGDVLEQRADGDDIIVSARLDVAQAGRLARWVDMAEVERPG